MSVIEPPRKSKRSMKKSESPSLHRPPSWFGEVGDVKQFITSTLAGPSPNFASAVLDVRSVVDR